MRIIHVNSLSLKNPVEKTLMISKTSAVAIEKLRIKYRIEPVGV
jgi:hypothetical protein